MAERRCETSCYELPRALFAYDRERKELGMLKRNWRSCFVCVLIAGAILLAVRECVRQFVYVSIGYCLEAEFATLPPDDKALCG